MVSEAADIRIPRRGWGGRRGVLECRRSTKRVHRVRELLGSMLRKCDEFVRGIKSAVSSV